MVHNRIKPAGIALLGLAMACMTPVWAATPVSLQHQPVSFLQSFVSASSSLHEVSSNVDMNKTAHVRLKQMYAGHQVWGGDAIMHIPHGGQIVGDKAMMSAMKANGTLNGTIYQNLDADLKSAPASVFDAAQADKALAHAKQIYAQKSLTKNALTESKTDLIVYVDNNNKAHWAFEVSFLDAPAHGLPAKPVYIMDASSFEVFTTWNNIQTDAADGGGNGGNIKMGKMSYDALTGDLPKLSVTRDASSNTCSLTNTDVTVKDRRNGDAVMSYKCVTADPDHNGVFWNGDQDAVNDGYSPSNDALYAGAVIKDMYNKWYGLQVLTNGDGSPMMLNMRVHEYMDNAYWDGSQMTFGDGIDMFYPLVSLGVGAHEISHGFTEQHSNLNYSGQSGGLNEAFSDMAAQAAEYYSVGHNSWQIGPEIFKAPDEALRYMDEPTKDCHGGTPGNWCSISNMKDYNSGLDVHFSSGIFNKTFYLMGTADGWNTKKAFDVMVLANTNYWTANTSFSEAACGVLSAAKDLGYDNAPIKAAFANVGVDISAC